MSFPLNIWVFQKIDIHPNSLILIYKHMGVLNYPFLRHPYIYIYIWIVNPLVLFCQMKKTGVDYVFCRMDLTSDMQAYAITICEWLELRQWDLPLTWTLVEKQMVQKNEHCHLVNQNIMRYGNENPFAIQNNIVILIIVAFLASLVSCWWTIAIWAILVVEAGVHGGCENSSAYHWFPFFEATILALKLR